MSKLTNEHAMAMLEDLIRSAPEFPYESVHSLDELRWLARCEAVLEALHQVGELVSFQQARAALGSYDHDRMELLAPLINAYHRLEIKSPNRPDAGFFPPGDTWNGYAAIVRLIQKASSSLLLVDPYMDGSMFTELLPHCNSGIVVKCLTDKGQYHKSLLAAFERWQTDKVSAEKRAEVRFAPVKALHDRIAIVDGQEVWLVSQSFKDIAKRSPATLTKADSDLTAAKLSHYADLWLASVSP